MKKLLLLFVLFGLFFIAKAQTDNEFWFVAPKVTKDHYGSGVGGQPIRLVFTNSNDNTAYIQVTMPANPTWVDTTIIVPKKTTKISLRKSNTSSMKVLIVQQ